MTKTNPREGKNWPGYLFGGRMRTSTLALILAFIGIGWLYETYEPPAPVPEQVPASEVVPPGFIPDPAYTWAPRTDVRRYTPTPTTTTEAPETTETPAPETTPTSPTVPPTTPTTPTSPAGVPPGPPGPPGPPTVTTPVAPQLAVTSTSVAPPPPPATPVPSGAVRPG